MEKRVSRVTKFCSFPYQSCVGFFQKITRFLTPRREEELSRGVVLIEFAVCMPILIILLFYIYDLVRIKRYYSQTEFIGQQMANILQNITKNRAIREDDIKHACSLAWLGIPSDQKNAEAYTNVYYVSKQKVSQQESFSWSQFLAKCPCDADESYYFKYTLAEGNGDGYYYLEDGDIEEQLRDELEYMTDNIDSFRITVASGSTDCTQFLGDGYVFREANSGGSNSESENGAGRCLWGIGLYRDRTNGWIKDKDISSDNSSSNIRWEANNSPADIYPSLKIDNKGKIIIETQFRLKLGSAKTAFGLYLTNPTSKVPDGSMFFSSVIIFTPKPGLFTETAPQ